MLDWCHTHFGTGDTNVKVKAGRQMIFFHENFGEKPGDGGVSFDYCSATSTHNDPEWVDREIEMRSAKVKFPWGFMGCTLTQKEGDGPLDLHWSVGCVMKEFLKKDPGHSAVTCDGEYHTYT